MYGKYTILGVTITDEVTFDIGRSYCTSSTVIRIRLLLYAPCSGDGGALEDMRETKR